MEELAKFLLSTKKGIGMVPPFYAEADAGPMWIVRNKQCNSLGKLMPRALAEELAIEMNKQVKAI